MKIAKINRHKGLIVEIGKVGLFIGLGGFAIDVLDGFHYEAYPFCRCDKIKEEKC